MGEEVVEGALENEGYTEGLGLAEGPEGNALGLPEDGSKLLVVVGMGVRVGLGDGAGESVGAEDGTPDTEGTADVPKEGEEEGAGDGLGDSDGDR